MTHLYILEGKIGRLDTEITPKEISGLCTDNFTSCNILVLISSNLQRYVLIHADQSIKPISINEELEWVGVNAHRFLLRRQESGYLAQSSSQTKDIVLRGINESFREILVKPDEEAVIITRGKLIPEIKTTLPADTEYHDQSALLFTHHMVETQFILTPLYSSMGYKQGYLQPLIFDAHTWTHYNNIDLSLLAKAAFQQKNIKDNTPAFIIFNTISDNNSSDERSRNMHSAAGIFSYFYLKTTDSISPESFFNKSYAWFLEPNHSSEKIRNTIEVIKKIKTFNEFLQKAIEIGQEAERLPNDIIFQNFSLQTEVMVNAYSIIFERFLRNSSNNIQDQVSTLLPRISEVRSQTQSTLSKEFHGLTMISEGIEILKKTINEIVPNKNWKVTKDRKIWLQLTNDEEAKIIVAHFNNNGYSDVKFSHKKDSPSTPIIVFENVDYNKLKNIPTLEITTPNKVKKL